jgi:S1-C subfamily serine protease
MILDDLDDNEVIDFIGARVKNLVTLGERSATGMDDTRGVLVVEVMPGSGGSGFLQANDVILSLNGVKVNKLRDLLEARRSVIGSGTEIVIFRNQQEIKLHIELNGK